MRPESALLPSLADEFFRQGVRSYVGTAWTINDLGAVEFARELYRKLLGEQGSTIGEAVHAARVKVHDRADYGALWAAYQHYGHPHCELRARAEVDADADNRAQ